MSATPSSVYSDATLPHPGGGFGPGAGWMIDFLLCAVAKVLLWLRYRVRVRGLDEVVRRGTKGVLFLPNHPALIDPFIVISQLHGRFRPRSLADRDQVARPFVRWMARRSATAAPACSPTFILPPRTGPRRISCARARPRNR